MTTGNISSGTANPYYPYHFRIWNGGDDLPLKRKWNAYTLRQATSVHSASPLGYQKGLGYNMNPIFSSDDRLRLLDRLSQEVRRHEFHAGVFLGTLHQSVRHLTGVAQTLQGVKKLLVKGDLSSALRLLPRSVSGRDIQTAHKKLNTKDIAGAHLAIAYGWTPLISDVRAMFTAVEVLANPPRRTSVMVSRKRVAVIQTSQSPRIYDCPGVKTSRQTIEYIMTEELSVPRSLGLTDLASVVHELTPWSFVADWFVPIGTYLQSLATIPHLKGVFRERHQTMVSGRCNASAGNIYYRGATASHKERLYQRLPESTSLSVPLPTFRGFDQLYGSTQRSLNAIALIRSLYK